MTFIGIISDNKYELEIKRILDNKLNDTDKDYTVIAINEKSIDNIKNIRFETILVMSLDRVIDKEEALNEILKKAKYLILNADLEETLEVINNMKLNIITFGFNSKSSITASSVEEKFLICIQRNFSNINLEIIEPQEVEVKEENKKLSNSSHNILGITSILLFYGKNTGNILKI